MSSTFVRRVLGAALVAAGAATAALAQQATVHGTVTDDAGTPLAGVKVILEPSDGAGVRVVTETRRKGTYLFGIVRPGAYHVHAELAGKVLVAVRGRAVDSAKKEAWKLDGRVRASQPPTIQLPDGAEATLDLTLEDEAKVAEETKQAEVAQADQALGPVIQKIQGGDCAGALPEIEQVLQKAPENARGHYLRGFCLGMAERDDEAVASLNRALELNPKFEGAAALAGQLQRRQGKLPEAETLFKKELETAQTEQVKTDAWIGLGLTYEAQNKDAEALAAFQKVAELAPSRPEAYLEMASLYTKTGQPDKAKEVLDKAQQMGASDPAAILNIGISYFNKKDYVRAADMFRQVVDAPASKPADQAMAQALLGKLLLRDGKKTEAVAAMKKSLELDPKGPLAEETRELLKAVGEK